MFPRYFGTDNPRLCPGQNRGHRPVSDRDLLTTYLSERGIGEYGFGGCVGENAYLTLITTLSYARGSRG